MQVISTMLAMHTLASIIKGASAESSKVVLPGGVDMDFFGTGSSSVQDQEGVGLGGSMYYT